MARLPMPPTRSNFLRVTAVLERAQMGAEMLERKRQILVMELMGRVEDARKAQAAVQDAMAGAWKALQQAATRHGVERLVRESGGIREAGRLRVRSRAVMGVDVPEVTFQPEDQPMPFGFAAGAAGADEVLGCFRAALEPIARLAEVENAVLRLAREVRRTQRRVNALEKTFIPNYDETLKFIADCLEEREREDLVIMKKVKTMRQAAQQRQPGSARPEAHHG